MKDTDGKVAFITGAASGMGLGMTKAFTRAGMRVMMADIDAQRLHAAAAELRAGGAEVDTFPCDITREEQVFAAAEATAQRFGKVHVLCNNAGVSVGGLSEELSQQDWDWVIAVNQTAIVYAMRAFLPGMKAHGESGHVVTTASMAGLINAGAGWGAYNASKHAAVAMMEVLYSELKDTPLGVSVLCPGAVNTNILEAAKHRPEQFGKSDDRPIALNPIGDTLAHGLDPDVVGELVLDGIRENQFYIFTDPGMEKQVERLYERIRLGFAWARNNEHLKAASQGELVWRTR
ncbi:MAG: SDR family NAD(P)-dependent oxidoreductase [Pseudomonadota bacterium]|jgi:NAD(P)-dependent dehydrogenase (short-subunit alcohol dehydrogenase family)